MDIDPMKMAYARLAQQAAIRSHLGDPNVSLIDIGLRRRKVPRLTRYATPAASPPNRYQSGTPAS